jgi:hypothetical protein
MKGQAFQTNPHPCARNKIYFAFAANVTLYEGIDITVVGLCDTLTPDDDAIEVNEIQNNDLLPAGKWNQSACTLKLTLGAHVDADKWIEFWVELRNPTENSANTCSTGRLLHTASTLRVSASAVCTNRYALTNDQNQVDLRSISENVALPDSTISLGEGFANAQIGDAAPLVVLRPHWFKRNIGQSTPYPGCINVITVTLAVSSPLVADCPIPFKIQIGVLLCICASIDRYQHIVTVNNHAASRKY